MLYTETMFMLPNYGGCRWGADKVRQGRQNRGV
jgi:hypothetical protein